MLPLGTIFLNLLPSITPIDMPAITSSSIKPQNILPAAIVHSKLTTPSLPKPSTSEAVVDSLVQAISNYLSTSSPDDQFASTGRPFLRSQVQSYVERDAALEL